MVRILIKEAEWNLCIYVLVNLFIVILRDEQCVFNEKKNLDRNNIPFIDILDYISFA